MAQRPSRCAGRREAANEGAGLDARRIASGREALVTPGQQELVRATFAKLAVMPDVAGALFYERLFAAHPDLRALFKHDMRVQGVKLMTMLAMVVFNLHQPGQVLSTIHDLGVRHVDYGVKVADYDALEDALIWMLSEALGEDFTAPARDAWTACYRELAEEMKTAARGALPDAG
jgi:nitric oxide dioxygenase